MQQIPLFKSIDGSKNSALKENAINKTKILSIFEDCHNYIYANEGILKEKAFREIIKILFIKIYFEKNISSESSSFKITKKEYQNIFSNISCKTFESRIKRLYQIMSKKSSLDIWSEGLFLSSKTMAYIVNRLQHIALKDAPGDIAGQAFQTFIHHCQRGERGEFFTPIPVVELAVQTIQPKHNERLIDPACGSGGFLLSAIRYIERETAYKKLSHYVMNNIHGIEFNPDVALSAKLLLEIEGGHESNIICENSLNIEDQHGSFDVVLTNPPFGRRGKVEDPTILDKYDLGKRWIQSKDNKWIIKKSALYGQAPEVLFIEKCLKLLKPEGRMATVLPDGLLQNPSLAFVRHWIKSQASVLGVISLPHDTFVPFGTGVKTSLLLLKKNFQRKSIFFSKIQNIGYDIKGNINYKKTSDMLKINKNQSNNYILDYIDSDINKVITTFKNRKRENKLSPISWQLKYEFLNDRWDAEHYSLKDIKMIEKLDSNQILSNFVEIVNYKEKFSKQSPVVVKYVAISDIDRHGMKIATHQSLYTNKLPSRASYQILKGDILVAISGANTGTERQAVAVVTKDYEGSICSNGFAVLRNVKNIDKYFFLAFLKTDMFIKQVKRMMTGHAIPCISLTNLGKIIVPNPDKAVQDRISKKTKRIINLSQIQHTEMISLKKDIELTQIK